MMRDGVHVGVFFPLSEISTLLERWEAAEMYLGKEMYHLGASTLDAYTYEGVGLKR
jgi:hypothetical protein